LTGVTENLNLGVMLTGVMPPIINELPDRCAGFDVDPPRFRRVRNARCFAVDDSPLLV
jgi:hypothetical protein